MTFHPLSIGSESFNQVGPGKYMKSTVTFGSPKDYIQIKGGTYNRKTGVTTASVSRQVEKHVDSESEADLASVQVVIQVPGSFTTSEIDNILLSLSDFLEVASLERLLQGEQ